jgi:hypothetical protein
MCFARFSGAFPSKASDDSLAIIPFFSAFGASCLATYFFPIFLENVLNIAPKLGFGLCFLVEKCSNFFS